MLKHGCTKPLLPTRVVVLGANGFVAASTIRRLKKLGVLVLGLPRTTLDLSQPGSSAKLAHILRPDDSLLFVAAKAPVKDEEMLIENLRMAAVVSEAIRQTPVKHLVYFSSDAVYADSDVPLTEHSCAQPTSLHGVMHLAREVMLAKAFSGPLCLLRPTLIYGADDPHNGYGPNRFMRQAVSGHPIQIFGEGEEQRDHIWIEDVAEVATRILLHESSGVVNVASGIVISFDQIADIVSGLFPGVTVYRQPRIGVMPHNGYRSFDVRVLCSAFPDLILTSVRETLPTLRDSFEAGR